VATRLSAVQRPGTWAGAESGDVAGTLAGDVGAERVECHEVVGRAGEGSGPVVGPGARPRPFVEGFSGSDRTCPLRM
jgi:hypothetical protein